VAEAAVDVVGIAVVEAVDAVGIAATVATAAIAGRRPSLFTLPSRA